MGPEEVNKILIANNSKNFIKRILFPDDKPKLDIGGGNVATHQMAWGEADGKFYVFPTIMQEPDGSLKEYGDDAFDEAIRRREFVQFESPKEAESFSKEYKKYWESIGYKP